MLDRTLLENLDAAAGELKAAEDKFRAVCRKIADDGIPPVQAEGKPSVAKPKKGLGRGKRAPVAGDLPGEAVKQYWKKVKCATCGIVTGSRVYQGVRYPVLHRDKTTGQPCKGSFQASVEAEKWE